MPEKERAWYPLFAQAFNFPEILWTAVLHPYNHDIKIVYYWYVVRACLQPELVASNRKMCLHGSPTEFEMSVCYEALPFVMDCKLARIGSNPGQYSASVM